MKNAEIQDKIFYIDEEPAVPFRTFLRREH